MTRFPAVQDSLTAAAADSRAEMLLKLVSSMERFESIGMKARNVRVVDEFRQDTVAK